MEAFDIKIPEQKPVDLAPPALPISEPQHAVRAYFISDAETHTRRKLPEWDIPRLAPEVELVKSRRELELGKKRLAVTRKQAIQKRADMDKKWETFREEEERLRLSFITFNKFLKDNKEKRERAEKKDIKDRVECLSKEGDVEELRAKLQNLNKVKNIMEQYVKDYVMYEAFLDSVCDEYDEFATVFEVLNRYDTLALTRDQLTARQAHDLTALEECRNELVKLTEENSNMMVGLNNKIAELQQRFDKAKSETLRWEASLSRIKDVTAEKTTEVERVRAACWDMYLLICKRKEMPIKLAPDDAEGQLNTIKRTIQKVRKLEKIAEKHIHGAHHETPTP